MDSPRLEGKSILAKLENHFFDSIPDYPDGLLVLSVDPVVARERKFVDLKVLEGKANSIKGLLRSDIGTIYLALSSNEPLKDIETSSEKFVWANLSSLSRRKP